MGQPQASIEAFSIPDRVRVPNKSTRCTFSRYAFLLRGRPDGAEWTLNNLTPPPVLHIFLSIPRITIIIAIIIAAASKPYTLGSPHKVESPEGKSRIPGPPFRLQQSACFPLQCCPHNAASAYYTALSVHYCVYPSLAALHAPAFPSKAEELGAWNSKHHTSVDQQLLFWLVTPGRAVLCAWTTSTRSRTFQRSNDQRQQTRQEENLYRQFES